MYQKSLFPPVPELPPQNVASLLLHRPEQDTWPDFTLHIDATSGRTRSFSEFRARVALGATALGASECLGLSLENGDMIGILSENCLDYYTLVHSSLAIKTPFALLPAHSKPFELLHLLKLSKLTKLFVQPKLLATVREVANQVGLSEDDIFLLEGKSVGKLSFDDLIQDAQRRRIPKVGIRPAEKDTLAFLAFSSGTTGLPKAVMTSHGNIIFSTLQAVVIFQSVGTYKHPSGIPVQLLFLPLYHPYGLHISCIRGFLNPVTVIVMPKWDIEKVFKLIPQYRVTGLLMIPSAVHQIVHHPNFLSTDWSSVITVGSGAAYLPPDLAKRFQQVVGIDYLAAGYGMSEATLSVGAVLPEGNALGLKMPPNSVGVLTPGLESRIMRDDGTDAYVNEPGELWIRGGGVTLGYYNNDKATRESFLPDGWLKTGDRMYADGTGLLYFKDRIKDTLKISGAQVSPTEIEAALRAHPDGLIIDVTVAGVSGGRTTDEKIPRAWVVLSETGKQRGEAASIEALNAWTQKNMSKYKWLRGGIEVVDEIPKSTTGKVLRRLLQDKYEEQIRQSKAKL